MSTEQSVPLSSSLPILEHDPKEEALLEPARLLEPAGVPEHGVACFFQEVIASLVESGRAKWVFSSRSEMGEHPVYVMEHEGRAAAVYHPLLGAPAAAAMLEEVIARGCRKLVVCGGAGVLDREVACGHVLVPTTAVRDEGTSYHYLPPAREVAAHPAAVAAIEETLRSRGVAYRLCKTWTTDAFYRETPSLIRRRLEEGCVAVEMEAAALFAVALFAVARFRGVTLGQILYGGDDCSGEE